MGDQARVDTMVVEGGLCFDLRLPPGALPGIQQLVRPRILAHFERVVFFRIRPCPPGRHAALRRTRPKSLARACKRLAHVIDHGPVNQCIACHIKCECAHYPGMSG
jgi:hypothetical protein